MARTTLTVVFVLMALFSAPLTRFASRREILDEDYWPSWFWLLKYPVFWALGAYIFFPVFAISAWVQERDADHAGILFTCWLVVACQYCYRLGYARAKDEYKHR